MHLDWRKKYRGTFRSVQRPEAGEGELEVADGCDCLSLKVLTVTWARWRT